MCTSGAAPSLPSLKEMRSFRPSANSNEATLLSSFRPHCFLTFFEDVSSNSSSCVAILSLRPNSHGYYLFVFCVLQHYYPQRGYIICYNGSVFVHSCACIQLFCAFLVFQTPATAATVGLCVCVLCSKLLSLCVFCFQLKLCYFVVC